LIIQTSTDRFFSGMKDMFLSRRRYLQVSALAGCSMLLGGQAFAKEEAGAVNSIQPVAAMPEAAEELRALMQRLAKAPRRRDFKTVPMILDTPDLWDAEALDAIIAYRGSWKQVWDNTEIGGPWLNLMRNSLNTQVFSFRHPDFLAVSATHGSAQLALYDQAMWDKYQLATMAGHDLKANTLIDPKNVPTEPATHEDPSSVFGPAGRDRQRDDFYGGCVLAGAASDGTQAAQPTPCTRVRVALVHRHVSFRAGNALERITWRATPCLGVAAPAQRV
jgi:hypothetical protein